MTDITIGIDISKAMLDVCRVPGGDTRHFTNDKSGLTALLRWMSAQDTLPVRIVFEATGAYHRLLERRLAEAHLPSSRSILDRPEALHKPSAAWPRPIASMPLCWLAWATRLNHDQSTALP
jgi:hypothetical protein